MKSITQRRMRRLAGWGLAVAAACLLAKPGALMGIGAYQRWISPHLGDCAYRRVMGGPSCSEYAKQHIRAEGVLTTLWQMPGQFQRCHEAAKLAKQSPHAASGAEICCVCSYLGCCYDWSEEIK